MVITVFMNWKTQCYKDVNCFKICLWIHMSTAFDRSWQSKLHIKMQKIKNNQDDEQGGSIYSTRYTAAVIKTVWYCLKDR